ncbi:MAG: cold shock domain-containing protein [Bacteroidota bacterium]
MDSENPKIRLIKVARELNIGIRYVITFLESKGYEVDRDPNSKLTIEQYNLCKDNFKQIPRTTIEEAFRHTENSQQKHDDHFIPTQIPSYNLKILGNIDFRSLPKIDYGVNQYIPNIQSWMMGQIKFFDNTKGFGFASSWDDKQDYFVHVSQVETNPISDNDFVVFKLKPSRKKPGTFEAIKVNLVSKFTQDPDYLIKQYIKYQDESLRKIILQVLPEKGKINLLESIIKQYNSIEFDDNNKEFKNSIKWVLSGNLSIELKDEIDKKLPLWIAQDKNPKFYIRLWLDGMISEPPKENIIIAYFLKIRGQERLQIFNYLAPEIKVNLLTTLTKSEEPEIIIDFILDHIKQINGIRDYFDIKEKLNDKKYWIDKKDYTLLTTTLEYYKNNLEEKRKLDLFFSGYLDSFPNEYVLANSINLTHDEIVKILQSKLLSKKETVLILKGQINKELNELNKPDNTINLTQSDITRYGSEWNEYKEISARPFLSLFEHFSRYIDVSGSREIGKIIKEIPIWLHFQLWEKGYTDLIPFEYISNNSVIDEDFQSKIERWMSNNRMTKEQVVKLIVANIQKQDKITSRREFYILHKYVRTLVNIDISYKDIEKQLDDNLWFFKLICWLEGLSSEFNFDEFKTKLVYLNPEHQIKFLRKVFWLKHSNKFNLTVEKLNQLVRIDFDIFKLNAKVNPDVHLDISVDIVIEAIKSFSENGKFLFDSQLLTLVLGNITNDKKFRFKISELFEDCKGRCGLEYDWRRNGEVSKQYFGNDQYYYAIQFNTGEGNFVEIKEKVKELPGSKWNPDKKHWGVPSKYKEQVLKFARDNRFFVDIEGGNYRNNVHLAKLKLKDIPNGIQFCEGRLANKQHEYFNKEFWWCCNQPCFNHCETIHKSEEWEKYTFLDFLLILGCHLDDGNRVGDYIEKGKFYQFISTINQFNRLLERMYCDSCSQILYPIEDSHFAHHRVVRFHCENEDCEEYHKEIYLHHCLNGKCNGIIDSRWSKKCPNGLYICSNENCGCCCSHDMLSRRLQNLRTTGGYIHPKLINAVDNKLGHLERAEHFCYKCGELMEELPDDVFRCNDCNISYDVSTNNFKRPHRHITNVKGSTSIDEIPPPEYDELFPF